MSEFIPNHPNQEGINPQPELQERHIQDDVFILGIGDSIATPEEIGLDVGNLQVKVIGKIQDANAKEVNGGIDVDIVRVENQFNSSFFIVTNYVSEDGDVTKKWKEIPRGVKITIGRGDESTKNDATHLDGNNLIGADFNNLVSRKHMSIELSDKGLVVEDHSSNGTNIKGKEVDFQLTPAEKLGVVDGEFAVMRHGKDGENPYLEKGWQVKETFINSDGDDYVTIIKLDEDGETVVSKTMPADRFHDVIDKYGSILNQNPNQSRITVVVQK